MQEAADLTTVIAEPADTNDVETQAIWRGIREGQQLRGERAEEPELLARDAVERLRTTDAPVCKRMLDLAEGLQLAAICATCSHRIAGARAVRPRGTRRVPGTRRTGATTVQRANRLRIGSR